MKEYTKKNKYKNEITYYKDIRFSSKKEMQRYKELKLMESANLIKDLELQEKFLLQEGYTNKAGKKIRPIYYIADFSYYDIEKKEYIVEDVKGIRTDVYKLKKKIFEYQYPDLVIKEL